MEITFVFVLLLKCLKIELKMKILLIVGSLCFASVLGVPAPDEELKLGTSNLVGNDAENSPVGESHIPKTHLQGAEPDRTRLLNELLTDYNKGVNPDNVTLNFGVNLIDFQVQQERNALSSYVWLKYVWYDSRLKWDPKEWGGVELLRVSPGSLWVPDVTLYNSADPVNMINCWQSNTLVYSTGKVLYVPPCKMLSHCDLHLTRYPYGEQTCTMKFGSWTYDGNVLDVQLYNGKKELDLSDMTNSSGFEVLSTTAARNTQYYSCCSEPYPNLTFNMTIKRVPGLLGN